MSGQQEEGVLDTVMGLHRTILTLENIRLRGMKAGQISSVSGILVQADAEHALAPLQHGSRISDLPPRRFHTALVASSSPKTRTTVTTASSGVIHFANSSAVKASSASPLRTGLRFDAGKARRCAALIGWPSYPPARIVTVASLVHKADGQSTGLAAISGLKVGKPT